jgi:hypothetical protein
MTLLFVLIAAAGGLGFGFLAGNRSAKGEGAAALAAAKAAASTVKTDAKKI